MYIYSELQYFSTSDFRLLHCLDIPITIEQNYPQSIAEGIYTAIHETIHTNTLATTNPSWTMLSC